MNLCFSRANHCIEYAVDNANLVHTDLLLVVLVIIVKIIGRFNFVFIIGIYEIFFINIFIGWKPEAYSNQSQPADVLRWEQHLKITCSSRGYG